MTEVSFMEHAQPVCVANSEGAQTMTAYTVGEAGRNSVVAEIRALVGADVVLLPIPLGEKGPRTKAWQQTTLDRMADPDYLQELESAGNIGVLLGKPSNGLCAIDIDADEMVEPFLALNPCLAGTLQTKGRRGVQIWIKVSGAYPKLAKVKTKDGADWGEWRSDGGQSVIHGVHPEGMNYHRLVDAAPITVEFADIHWPEDLELPWATSDYDVLVEAEGSPYSVSDKGGVILNQMFFVRKYMLEHVITYDAGLGDFYEYAPEDGLWKRQTVDSIKRVLSADLTKTAKTTGQHSIYQKRTDALMNGLVALLRAQSECKVAFENRPQAIHVKNGMICFEDGVAKLTTFHSDFLSRNQCPYSLELDADCPRFRKELLGIALDPADILLLQKWAGAVLLGRNAAQRMLLLMGTPNGGKSTLMTILERVVGMQNIAQLRTQHLGDHFELFAYIGKTLLAGKDVAGDFLMQKGAHVLKALVGGDLLEAEKKGFNERIPIRGDFNVGITCNADLNIRLEGDEGAWRRRLLIIKYTRKAPARRIPDFAEKLLAEEGPGILRWMVEGAMLLHTDLDECGDYRLTAEQRGRIDNIMSQSESLQRFVETCVHREDGASIAQTELKGEYYSFCESKGWNPLPERQVNSDLEKIMAEVHRVCSRHDIRRGVNTVRGFKNVALVKAEDQIDEN